MAALHTTSSTAIAATIRGSDSAAPSRLDRNHWRAMLRSVPKTLGGVMRTSYLFCEILAVTRLDAIVTECARSC
jgi:hypothetical protein